MQAKRKKSQIAGLIAGPVLFVSIILWNFAPDNPEAVRTAACAAWMAAWWMTEAIPLAATALFPLILFPILGIATGKTIAPVYFNSTIFLFIGGFLIAISMERWNLHKRISLLIIRFIGTGLSRLILGFMIASAFLSMFISNTATAIMMLPIGLAIISKMEDDYSTENVHSFAAALMLGIAYAASVGGVATLVGTPPNLVFRQIFANTFPGGPEISFGTWMIFGLPLSMVMLIFVWIMLTKVLFRFSKDIRVDRSVVDKEYRELGKTSYEEKAVLVVFVLTGLLWIFRKEIDAGFLSIPGWSGLLDIGDFIDDGTVAVFMAAALFLIPAKSNNNAVAILDENAFGKLPWHIIILFGGGFALAEGFQLSGLSQVLGKHFAALQGVNIFILVLIITAVIVLLTELTSNTATTQTLLPILASVAVGLKLNPMLLMIPATIAASYAFMLPVATPPNAIVFGSGRIRIAEMTYAGVLINIFGVLLITLMFYFLGSFVFNIDLTTCPSWAE